jgi:hypothetical protein
MLFIEHPARAATPQVAAVVAATAGANALVAITLVGVAGYRHYLPFLVWSYSGLPTGRLTISGLDGDDVDFDITAAGAGPVFFPPLAGTIGASVVITLAAGGAGVVGKLNVCAGLLPAYLRFEGRILVGG